MILLGPYLMAAALLVVAGVAKAARPGDTALALRQAVGGPSRPVWSAAVRFGAGAEAVLGVVALARPSTGLAVAVAASYAAFTAWVVVARLRGGPLATCGCFGEPDTPPTLGHIAIDLLGVASAAAVAASGPSGGLLHVLSRQPDHGLPLVAGAVVATWLALLVLVPLSRLQALRAWDPPPPLAGPPAPDAHPLPLGGAHP